MISLPTKPTIYHIQYYSSSRPLWLLMELGIVGREKETNSPIQLKTLTHDELKKDPVLTQLNPQRRLPLFVDPTKGENLVLTESGGLVQYLLETYDPQHQFHPKPDDTTRPEFLKLIHFGPATCYHIGVPLLFPDTISEKELEKKKGEWHEIVAPTLEQALNKFGGPYLLGEEFSAADVVVGYDVMTIFFTKYAKELLEPHPLVNEYLKKISIRSAYKKLFTHPKAPAQREEK